jgi:tetratricopeptide (TPR) repeat protein
MTTLPPVTLHDRERAIHHLEQARYHSRRNERGEWLMCANQAVLADSTYVEAWIVRGQARQEIGDLRGAFADYERAITLDPTSARAYYSRGWAKGVSGDYLGEIEDTEHAYQLEPDTTSMYWRRLGHAYAGLGDYNRALDYYQSALTLRSDDMGVLFNRAVLYYQQEEYRHALQDLEAVLGMQKNWAWALKYKGACEVALKQYGNAIENLSHALKYEPTSAWSYALRAEAYTALGDTERAERDARIAAELDPQYAPRSPCDVTPKPLKGLSDPV